MVTNPQAPDREPPDYPEYAELRAEADRRAGQPVDPGRLGLYQRLADRHPWASRVLGFHCHGARFLGHADAELLALADERGIDPPEPQWMAEVRRRDEEHRAQAASQRAFHANVQRQIDERDEAAWRAVLAGVDPLVVALIRVFRNPTARTRMGYSHQLGHVVPIVELYSGTTRVHRPWRALCESPARSKPLRLETSSSEEPATCDRCLAWTAKVRSTR